MPEGRKKKRQFLLNTSYLYCSAAAFCQIRRLNSRQELLLHQDVALCECFYFTLRWKSERLQAALARGSAVWLTALLVFDPTFLQLFWFIFCVCQHRLHVSFVSFQDGVWPPWVGGVFPARRWAEETARAGCGEREMRRVTFLRSGRSTGLFWRTTACTGTSTRRRVAFYTCPRHFPAS